MKPRILIVEDESFMARIIGQHLRELEYDPVSTTAYGEEAVSLAASTHYDLALVDIHLAGEMDGIEAATIMHDRFGLPTVFLTTNLANAPKERVMLAHPFGYIGKPFSQPELSLIMEMALQRKRAEAALRDSEQQLESVLHTSMDAFWICGIDGRIIEMNGAAIRMTGYSREELLRMNIVQLAHGRTTEEIAAGIESVMSLGTGQIECSLLRKDGQIRLIETRVTCSAAPLRHLYCFGRDITVRRNTEKRLELLDRAVEQSPASIVITDLKGGIEYVNPYFEKLTGYSFQDVLGQNPRVLKSGSQPAAFYKELWETITAGQEWRGEMCNRRKDGTLFWEQASISPVRDSDGKVMHFVAVKEDVTQRKHAEQTIAWQAALFANSEDLCCVKDLDLRILTCNAALARAVGAADPESMIGKTDADVFGRPESDPMIEGYMNDERAAQKLGPGKFIEREEKMVNYQGVECYLLTRKFPVFDRDGKIIATGNISTDITERKRTEQELIRAKDEAESANRAKSAFLAMMSHELRTPLNVINGLSAVLAQGNWPTEQKHAIDLISEGGHTLLNIVEEILDYSGLQAGKTMLDSAPFSIVTVVSSVLRACSPSAQNKGLTLTCWLDPKTPAEVIGDPRRLRQILTNLLNNAIKFTECGRIHLRLAVRAITSDAYTVEFSLLDSGIGIAPRNAAKLFQPFSQADNTITRRYGGTGLGLAITKSFVNLMGGEIDVRSRQGVGSVFRFYVKLRPTQNRALAFSSLPSAALQKRRVLILAGTGPQHRMLESLIRTWGMQPVVMPRTQTVLVPTANEVDLAILPIDASQDESHPLSRWLAEPGHGSKIPIAWLGRKDAATPTGCTAPSIRLGTLIDPVELRQVLSDLIATRSAASPQPNGQANKLRPLAETIPLSILAAEDNATNREVIKLVLRNLGYTVDLVENGLEAVHAVKAKKYDLLLLDMQMPVMDGLTAAREICQLIPDPQRRVKMVALTANALPGDRERCLDAGMDAYLTKPILPADLAACLRRVFEGGVVPSPTVAAPTQIPNRPAEQPLVDTAHLETITTGMSPEQSLDALRQLQLTVCDDYQLNLPRVRELCAHQDKPGFAETIHGLKGCFMMIGWIRAGTRCAEALAEARKGTFKEWTTFTDELEKLFSQSSAAMVRYLEDLSHRESPVPAVSEPLSVTERRFSP